MRKQTIHVLVAALAYALGTVQVGATPQASSSSRRPTAPASGGSLLNPSSLRLQAPATYYVKFVTTKGDFYAEINRDWSPRGADRFYNLVKYHFFDGGAFFRVLQNFVAQFGISPRPEVSRAWERATIPDDPVKQSNARGTLTFATAGPNTRTTQIFINLGDNSGNLDQLGFSPFGKVVSGMDVVDKFYSDYSDAPPDGHGPDQNRLQREGKTYVDKAFNLLDSIKTATIVPHSAVPQAAQATPGVH